MTSWILQNPEKAKTWNTASNVIVVLEVENAEALHNLHAKLTNSTGFFEPDLLNEITALAVLPEELYEHELLQVLPLAKNSEGAAVHKNKFKLSRKMQLAPVKNSRSDGKTWEQNRKELIELNVKYQKQLQTLYRM